MERKRNQLVHGVKLSAAVFIEVQSKISARINVGAAEFRFDNPNDRLAMNSGPSMRSI